jgi:hydroxyethylthiazole kinase
MALAGEKAAQDADGPGSFAPAFLDALWTLEAPDETH